MRSCRVVCVDCEQPAEAGRGARATELKETDTDDQLTRARKNPVHVPPLSFAPLRTSSYVPCGLTELGDGSEEAQGGHTERDELEFEREGDRHEERSHEKTRRNSSSTAWSLRQWRTFPCVDRQDDILHDDELAKRTIHLHG